MSRTARNIVEAIQHSLLGSLLAVLVWPSGFLIFHALLHLLPKQMAGPVSLSFLGLVIPFGFGAWILGYLARPASRTFSPGGHLQPEPPNGFDVWRRLPESGLRPPPFMRWLVIVAGRSSDRRPRWWSLAIFFGSMAFLGALIFVSDARWAEIHPWLGLRDHRGFASLLPLAVLTALLMRVWATGQRARLAPLDD